MATFVQIHTGGFMIESTDFREGKADGLNDAKAQHSYGLTATTLEGAYGTGYDEGYHEGLKR